MFTKSKMALLCLLVSPWLAAQSLTPEKGMIVGAEEIESVSLTVLPDGQGLPAGGGTAQQGEALYQAQCASCHGSQGNNGIVVPLAGTDKPASGTGWSVGASWPYATSIFDYVRRAMPPFAPKQLSESQTYALTAYILYLNGLAEYEQVIDRDSLVGIKMPALEYTRNKWEAEEKYYKSP